MMFAWKVGETDRALSNRIDARNHPNRIAECPLCGREVVSRLINTVWQWKHEKGCSQRRPKK